MKTHCPQCGTTYKVDRKLVRDAQGLARCFNCGKVFNVFGNKTTPGRESHAGPLQPTAASENEDIDLLNLGDGKPSLPFDVPNDLPALQASGNVALDVHDTLNPSTHRRPPWWQKLLVAVLILMLVLQVAWLRRDLWIHLPATVQLCAWLKCQAPQQARPDLFDVVERDMRAVSGDPPALRLDLSFRNNAEFSQPLPDLQLSLLDSNGSLVARRLLHPDQYLPSSWSGPPVATPREVVTIELMLEDPGPRVRGFVFDFL